jgi:tetratricopeptide (TPR) repeat protein
MQRLAAEAPIETLSPAILEALANRLWLQGINDMDLLRRMQARYPSDYFLNMVPARSLADVAMGLQGDQADFVREEAIGFARSAVAARPGLPTAWGDLGVLLSEQVRLEEAEVALRKAVSLQPNNARFHALLSAPLRIQGRLDEAEEACQTAIRLNPKYGIAYSMLANTLLLKGRFAETEAACQKAISLHPAHPWPYFHLARAMRAQGKSARADAYEQEAERRRPGIMSKLHIRGAEHEDRLLPKLQGWLQGKVRPGDALDLTVLGFLAAHRLGRFDATVQLFARSFAERPGFAEATVDFPSARPRYFGACCAAEASRGAGDAARLNEDERGQRRQQALTWLRQELAYWDKQIAEKAPAAPVRAYHALNYWRLDGWLAGVRDPRITATFPPAERDACRKLWDDVATVLRKAEEKK